MKSVLYRPTGKFTTQGARPKLANREIVRNNEIFAPDFLEPFDLHRKSIFVNGDRENGVDLRLNAVGDSADSSTGYQIVTDTLTFIKQQISDQVFYKVAPAEYMPVVVGEGSMSANLLFNRSFNNAEDFEAGNIRTAVGEARLSVADAAVDGVTSPVMNGAKKVGYTLFEVEQALRANTWDPIMAKHKSRKENWDLGIQATAFLGLATDTRFAGLLNQPSVNTNTSLITGYIKNMNAAALQTFVAGLLSAYFTNTNSTRVPNRFVIPALDYLGLTELTTGTVGTYPLSADQVSPRRLHRGRRRVRRDGLQDPPVRLLRSREQRRPRDQSRFVCALPGRPGDAAIQRADALHLDPGEQPGQFLLR